MPDESPSTSTPRVSVAVLTYNVGPYVAAAITGVLQQTFTDFELIIVDDCSTDDTCAIIRQFTDARIRFFENDKNLGFAGNVNRAMELVRGELVSFPGSDDIWEPLFLERAVAFLDAAKNISWVHSGATWIDSVGTPFGQSKPGWHTITPGKTAFMKALDVGFVFPAVLMRTDAVRKVGPLSQWWGGLADSYLVLHLCLLGDAGYIDRQLVKYRVHDKSISLVMYQSGEYFRHHRDIIASAFDWPESKAAGLDRFKNQGLRYVARDSIQMLHINRATMGRWPFVRQYFRIIGQSPGLLLHPGTWARLVLGLLPRTFIRSLRDWKRRHWHTAQSTAAPPPHPRVIA